MEWLKPRTGSSNAKKGKDMDTSNANKGYYIAIVGDEGAGMGPTGRGWQRAAFEHNRRVAKDF